IFLNGVYTNSQQGLSYIKAMEHSRNKQAQLARIAEDSTAIIDNPPAGHMHARPFYNHSIIGFPIQPLAQETGEAPEVAAAPGAPVRILHAPSNEAVKGTALIRRIVAELQQEGHAIEFVTITKMPNSAVLAALVSCDFVIDQAYSDVPL